jgi:hypothetical protein
MNPVFCKLTPDVVAAIAANDRSHFFVNAFILAAILTGALWLAQRAIRKKVWPFAILAATVIIIFSYVGLSMVIDIRLLSKSPEAYIVMKYGTTHHQD